MVLSKLSDLTDFQIIKLDYRLILEDSDNIDKIKEDMLIISIKCFITEAAGI